MTLLVKLVAFQCKGIIKVSVALADLNPNLFFQSRLPFLSWESSRRDLNSNLQAVQKSLTLSSPLAQQKKPSRANVANAPDSRHSVRINRPLRQNAFSRKRRRFVKIRSVMELPVCKKLSRSSPLRFPVLLPSPRPCCST